MKKIFTYMALAAVALLTACSDNDVADISTGTNPLDEQLDKFAVTGTMAISSEFEGGIGDDDLVISKSKLFYDRLYNKLKFTWVEGDRIGIFAESNVKEQYPFVLVGGEENLIVSSTSVSGEFAPVNAIDPINVTTKYYSYFPYIEQNEETGDFTYNEVPVTYRNQTQTANEKMNYYYLNTVESQAQFLQSEKDATAHLAAKDYMISDATSTAAAHVHFKYSHMGSIVRFFIQCPAAANPGLFIDSLQVVNNSRAFTTDAEMNLSTKELKPSATSRVMSLKFAPAIDMTNGSDNTKETYNYWYDGTYGFIMAYMMMAPIDLTAEGVENSTLYMIARQPKYYTTAAEYNAYYGTEYDDTDFAAFTQAAKMKVYKDVSAYNAAKEPDISPSAFDDLPVDKKLIDPDRKVYKATLSKINFLAGKHYQWVSALNPDSPITFDEISIETWKTGTEFTNTDGDGTEDW